MDLPQKPIEPAVKDPRTLIVYGPPKIGKTTILAGLPNNLIVDIEQGSEYVTALKKSISGLKEFGELSTAIKEAGHPYSFSTLDTATKLEEWAEKAATYKYKNTQQGKNFKGRSVIELDYGLGYGLLRHEFKQWLNLFYGMSKYSVLVGHVKDRMIGKEGDEVTVKDLNLTGQLKAITTSHVDAIGYIYIDKEDPKKRRITFITSDEIVCGNRCPHLEGQDFVISEKNEDNSVTTYWEKIYTHLQK